MRVSGLIDSHAHVSFAQFDEDREAVVSRAREAGVRWIEIGTDLSQSKRSLMLAREYPKNVAGATVGVHPSDLGPDGGPDGSPGERAPGRDFIEADWEAVVPLVDDDAVVAVGEVGFDFWHAWSGYSLDAMRSRQEEWLRRFVSLAVERDLPVVFHVRSHADLDAHEALLALLQSLPDGERPRGVVHTYSGTVQQAERYVALGLYLSFSGVLTFKNAQEMREAARLVPLNRVLVETDCPFLTPEPHRSQRNEPAYVQLVVQELAALRGAGADEIAQTCAQNTATLFRLS